MMCHDAPKDCDACHAEKDLDIGKMPTVYHPIIGERPKGAVDQDLSRRARSSMAQCIYCHPDLDAITPGRLIFAHAAHLQRNYSCEACHPSSRTTRRASTKPDMMSCYRCHGLVPQRPGPRRRRPGLPQVPPQGLRAHAERPHQEVHPGHAQQAREQATPRTARCATRRSSASTATAARERARTRRKPVIPHGPQGREVAATHGDLFLDGKGACGACHDGPSCQRCHKTVMPHPADWIKDHKPQERHPERGLQHLPHGPDRTVRTAITASVKQRGARRRRTARPCHDEMKQKPATEIKNKGFAEHAVHFNVEEAKGKPYKCYECHVDFGTSDAAQKLEAAGSRPALVLRLPRRARPVQHTIAPYKGAELCFRCHSDLNI